MWPSTFLASICAVKARPLAKAAWLFCLCLQLTFLAEARAQSYSLSTDPTADLLTITFPQSAPQPVVLRTGTTRIEMLFPAGTKLKGVPGGAVKGRHIAGLGVADNVLVVETSDDAFSFITSTRGGKVVQLQVFYDPSGTRWKPDSGAQAQAPKGQAPPGQQPPVAPPQGQKPAPQAAPAVEAPGAEPAAKAPAGEAGGKVTGTIDFPGTPLAASSSAPPASPSPTPSPTPSSAPAPTPSPTRTRGVTGAIELPTSPSGQPSASQAGSPQQERAPSAQPGQASVSKPSSSEPGVTQSEQIPASQVQPATSGGQPTSPNAVGATSPVAPPTTAPGQAPAEAPRARGEVPWPGTAQAEAPQAKGETGQAKPAASEVPTPKPPVAKGQIGEPQPAKGQAGETPVTPAPEPSKTDEAAKAALTAKAPPAPSPEAAPEPPQGTPKEPADSMSDKALLIGAEQAMARGFVDKALLAARNLLAKPTISKDMREEALYLQAEAVFAQNKDKMPEAFEQTNDVLQQALNFNTASTNVPRALIKLGYINLRQGNIPEARAYFNLMRNKYPMDEEIPLIDVYWGEHFMEQAKLHDPKANYELAAQSFKDVLQKNPESRFARDAALGLSRALFELRQYDEANKIVDYIDKRWPRYYLENPTLRRVSADIAYKLGDFAKAKDDYLWFYNLVPKDPSNDLVLARLGDVSVRLNQMDAARDFYDMAIRLYPGKEGALMAMMRLAEQGIHDSPDLQEMLKTFADPKDIKPDKIYEIIVNEYPKSPLAPLALIKLAMWNMYKQAYPRTLELADQFIKDYPDDELEKQAVELAAQAFAKMIGPLLEESDYKRVLELWRTYPYVASRADLFTDHDRLGVALALYYQGAPKEALTMVEPYLDKGPTPDSQKALALILTIYRENQDWQALLDTVHKVESWTLADNPRRALEFAQAMALEHTGDRARSSLLWARLAADNQLDPAKMAYAVYYQARTAYDRKDYDQCLKWAQDSRTLFKEAAKDEGMARDALLLMIQADQSAGRFREALKLCEDYGKEAPENSAEWAANRLRMASLYRVLGNPDQWRKILEEMRDKQGDSLYGKLAASELSARGLEESAGQLK